MFVAEKNYETWKLQKRALRLALGIITNLMQISYNEVTSYRSPRTELGILPWKFSNVSTAWILYRIE